MEKYIPDMYQKSIYTIDYNKLYNRGIKCILFDLDNTLVPINAKITSKKLKEFIEELKQKGFKIIIFSNSQKNRVKPFGESLDVDYYPTALKPFPKKLNKLLEKYNYKQAEVAIIGDQMLTDIVVGNKAGITTILVNPISKKDLFFTKFNRFRERHIMKRLRNNNLFVKGRYYE